MDQKQNILEYTIEFGKSAALEMLSFADELFNFQEKADGKPLLYMYPSQEINPEDNSSLKNTLKVRLDKSQKNMTGKVKRLAENAEYNQPKIQVANYGGTDSTLGVFGGRTELIMNAGLHVQNEFRKVRDPSGTYRVQELESLRVGSKEKPFMVEWQESGKNIILRSVAKAANQVRQAVRTLTTIRVTSVEDLSSLNDLQRVVKQHYKHIDTFSIVVGVKPGYPNVKDAIIEAAGKNKTHVRAKLDEPVTGSPNVASKKAQEDELPEHVRKVLENNKKRASGQEPDGPAYLKNLQKLADQDDAYQQKLSGNDPEARTK